MDIIVDVQHVSKSYGGECVLHDVTRRFERGKIHGIVGNNGSGKTVLMKCICGFTAPDSGTVFVNGKRIGHDIDFADDLGIIIETPGFLPNLSGTANLKLLASLNRKADAHIIRQTIEKVGLDPDLKKPVGKYSLGMRQRLGLAQALMEDPSLLILDEPFNGLDKQGTAYIRSLLHGLRDEGKTIILSSHNPQDIEELCDSVFEMDSGIMTVLRDA